ncbi:hypothetical protein [Pseudophaeobacter sp.]|uniref:hypothetical protein n=1 Tax=Pseudophaeobacter sp. TaxID=1971739 RepID=UPI003296A95C
MSMNLTQEPRNTSEIYARRFLDFGPDETIINWAENMVLAGYDTCSLSILLGEIAPFNKFEIDEMLDCIHSELQLPKIQNRSEALKIIATVYVHRFLAGVTNSASTLFALTQLYINEERDDVLYDFYLLHNAAADLEFEEIQYYWPDANRKNIEKIILDRCRSWIEQHPLNSWRRFECAFS